LESGEFILAIENDIFGHNFALTLYRQTPLRRGAGFEIIGSLSLSLSLLDSLGTIVALLLIQSGRAPAFVALLLALAIMPFCWGGGLNA
jgi:hypothetical protein